MEEEDDREIDKNSNHCRLRSALQKSLLAVSPALDPRNQRSNKVKRYQNLSALFELILIINENCWCDQISGKCVNE